MKEGIDFFNIFSLSAENSFESMRTDLRFKGLQNYDQLLIDVILWLIFMNLLFKLKNYVVCQQLCAGRPKTILGSQRKSGIA